MVQRYDEQWWKNVERSVRSIICLEGLRTPRNISDRTACLLAETSNRVVPTNKQEFYPLATMFNASPFASYERENRFTPPSEEHSDQDADEETWT